MRRHARRSTISRRCSSARRIPPLATTRDSMTAAARSAGRVHVGEDPRDRCDQRIRDGDRQAERPPRDPLRDAGDSRGLLSGSGSSGPRRKSFGRLSPPRLSRSLHPRVFHQGLVSGEVVVEKIYDALKKLSDGKASSASNRKTRPRVKAQGQQLGDRGRDQDTRARGAVTSATVSRRACMCDCSRRRNESSGSSPATANSELGLLRALWRGVGAALKTGAVVDLDGLPPGLGGAADRLRCSNRLQDRQFLTWERRGQWTLSGRCESAPITKYKIDWAAHGPAARLPRSPSSRQSRNTRTPRNAGGASCFAISVIPRRVRSARVATTVWESSELSASSKPSAATPSKGQG